MNKPETLEEFYRIKIPGQDGARQRPIGDFHVFVIEDTVTPEGNLLINYARRDFYKICLTSGSHLFHYADKTMKIEGTNLIFFNPLTPYKWESMSKDYGGYFCIFKEAFFTEKLRNNLGELPMFAPGGKPAYPVNEQQAEALSEIFRKMIAEESSDYKFKQDVLVSHVTEMVHYAMKMEPKEIDIQPTDGKARITSLFTELLERQFPIYSTEQDLPLRSPKDFASQLFIHVNYLNSAVKETTGKTTSKLIADRLATEAKILLKHTSWNVSEIGYALGFEDASHFNNFFKKHTDLSPSRYRAGMPGN
jgi:AraC-like DNA-binding protein